MLVEVVHGGQLTILELLLGGAGDEIDPGQQADRAVAMRLKRLSLPTACSMRARALYSIFGKNAGLSMAFDLNGMTGQMPRRRAPSRLAFASYPLSVIAARGAMSSDERPAASRRDRPSDGSSSKSRHANGRALYRLAPFCAGCRNMGAHHGGV